MKLQVSATRMELLKLKKRSVVAKRGHKLLKDKFDELMRKFMELIKGYKALHLEVEEGIHQAYSYFITARAHTPLRELVSLLTPSRDRTIEIDINLKYIMNVRIPNIKLVSELSSTSYGYATTTSELDMAIGKYKQILPKMLMLAERRKTIQMLCKEIETTRRRVNALEYVLIPSIEETMKEITMKLNELERSNLSRLMKVKDIVRK